LYLDHSNV